MASQKETRKYTLIMNILVVGSGGRENALAWKLAQSPRCDALFIAPGNGGSPNTLPIDPLDFEALAKAIQTHAIGLVVVGPEQPLAEGLVDFLRERRDLGPLKVVGPRRAAAMLESSKDFAKSFMVRHGIPTAKHKTFTKQELVEGYRFIDSLRPPYVLKADGLAGGKGVLILPDADTAKRELSLMLKTEKHSEASPKVVIEEFLPGKECSVFVLSNGKDFVFLPTAKDYKRVGEGDQGPNTGGMGVVAPWPHSSPEFLAEVERDIVRPTLLGMAEEGQPYTGFLYVGLMVVEGKPYVIEYNCRMGDPETQAVMPLIKSDLLPWLEGSAGGNWPEGMLEPEAGVAATVVLCANGYPGTYETGMPLRISESDRALVFQAGTRRSGEHLLSQGGRVLAVTGLGADLEEALDVAYGYLSENPWSAGFYRRDIGYEWLGESKA
jgi:phosphoribosylamine--glycine ligase